MIKTDWSSSYFSKPREMKDDKIDLVSTSKKTADASPIILNKTDRVQTKFIPVVVKNENDPSLCVSGKLVYEKKRENDNEFPTDKLTRQSIKIGESMEISLKTSETYNLFQGLSSLYALYKDVGETHKGSATYAKVDNDFTQFLSLLKTDPSAVRLLGQSENFELVKILLRIITQTDSLESLENSLKELEQANISTLTNALSVERMERVVTLLINNLENDDEETWQSIFTENQWILSQIFACPYTIFKDKAYVGGKSIENKGGNICDFIYQNNLTKNLALIEIKTPCTSLLGKQYRGTFSLSTDLSGAVNQILNYKMNITQEFYASSYNSETKFEVVNPKCFVIIGKLIDLNPSQTNTFENFRNALNNVTIITFDELLERIKDILAVFKTEKSAENTEYTDDSEIGTDDDDLPF